MAEKRQGDKLDPSSLDIEGGGELEEEGYGEQPEVEAINEEDERNLPYYESPNNNKFLIAVLVSAVAVLIIFFMYFNKDSSETTPSSQDGEKSFISSILSFGKDDAVSEEVTENLEGENLVDTIMLELQVDYPEYTIALNAETNLIEVIGVNLDGMEHSIYYSAEGVIVDELVNGTSILNQDVDLVANTSSEAILTPEEKVAQANSKDAVTGEDLVTIKLTDFNKTYLSLDKQQIVEKYNEYGGVDQENYTERLIVQYEKLPLRGKLPVIYAVVIESGEKVIFNPTLEEYMSLEQKGTTVLEVEVTKMHGVESYDRIQIYEINR